MVKAKHPSIVPIELWNQANAGKRRIVKNPGSLTGWKLENIKTGSNRSYNRENPAFPFKSLICCHECQKPLMAAFSRGKSGKKFPLYFCNRSHKQVSINPSDLENLLVDVLEEYRFSKQLFDQWEWAVRTMWDGFLNQSTNLIEAQNEKLKELENRAEAISEKILLVSHIDLVSKLEKDYANVKDEIGLTELKLDEVPENKVDIDLVIKTSAETIEHLGEYIANPQQTGVLKALWGFIFPTNPTLQDLENRTPQISPILAYGDKLKDDENALVSPKTPESNTLKSEIIRWDQVLRQISDQKDTALM